MSAGRRNVQCCWLINHAFQRRRRCSGCRTLRRKSRAASASLRIRPAVQCSILCSIFCTKQSTFFHEQRPLFWIFGEQRIFAILALFTFLREQRTFLTVLSAHSIVCTVVGCFFQHGVHLLCAGWRGNSWGRRQSDPYTPRCGVR